MSPLYDSARDNLVKWHFKVNEPRKDLNYRPIRANFDNMYKH